MLEPQTLEQTSTTTEDAYLSILKVGDPLEHILTEPTTPVEVFDFKLANTINRMQAAMKHAGGAGLAAPQVGVGLSVIVLNDSRWPVLVNPRIVFAKGSETRNEGCLSIPDVTVEVERATKIVVEAQDAEGKALRISAQGPLARLLQHEIDHLHGVLITRRGK